MSYRKGWGIDGSKRVFIFALLSLPPLFSPLIGVVVMVVDIARVVSVVIFVSMAPADAGQLMSSLVGVSVAPVVGLNFYVLSLPLMSDGGTV